MRRSNRLAPHHQRRVAASSGGGLSGLGDTSQVEYASNAVIAPQFRANQPGTYEVKVKVTAVPTNVEKRPYFDLARWNDSLAQQGYSGVTVTKVEYVVTSEDELNARSTGGPLDLFDWGTVVTDNTYKLTVNVSGDDSGMGGLGFAAPAGVVVAGVIIAASLIFYWVTGENLIVQSVKWLGQGLAAGLKPLADAAPSILLPIILVGGVALLIFSKLGGRGSYKGFSIGGGK